MRILILSTPKTGNTWLLNLLSSIYDLPKVGLVYPFDRAQADGLGKRWALFHHLRPSPQLLAWIDEAKPALLTTIRHPGDVLVSLYHHVNGFQATSTDPDSLRRMLTDPFPHAGIEPAGERTFAEDLACSIEWLRTRRAKAVRYEDLRRDAIGTLSALTREIEPVPEWRIERAVERCDIGLMRGMAGAHAGFFRSGRTGEWREQLDPETIKLLGASPYAQQLEELGYSLSETDLPAETSATRDAKYNPFASHASFANGMAAAPVIVDLYLSLDPARTMVWGDARAIGPGSFYAWLNTPAGVPARGIFSRIGLSNLAVHVHRERTDLNQTFRDLGGIDRVLYADWFVRNAGLEFGLEACFVESMRADLQAWAATELPPGAAGWSWNSYADTLGEGIGLGRDLFESQGWAFLEWLAASKDAAVPDDWRALVRKRAERHRTAGLFDTDAEIVQRLGEVKNPGALPANGFFGWLNAPSSSTGKDSYAAIEISNLAWYVYRSRVDLVDAFPDLAGPQRADFLEWFVYHAGFEFGLDDRFVSAMRKKWLAWGTAASPEDTGSGAALPRLTNSALHFYRSRPDLQREFPDVFGEHRWDYLRWFVWNARLSNVRPELIEFVARRLNWLARIQPLGRLIAEARRIMRRTTTRG